MLKIRGNARQLSISLCAEVGSVVCDIGLAPIGVECDISPAPKPGGTVFYGIHADDIEVIMTLEFPGVDAGIKEWSLWEKLKCRQ